MDFQLYFVLAFFTTALQLQPSMTVPFNFFALQMFECIKNNHITISLFTDSESIWTREHHQWLFSKCQDPFPRFLIIRLSRLHLRTGRRTDKGLWRQNTSGTRHQVNHRFFRKNGEEIMFFCMRNLIDWKKAVFTCTSFFPPNRRFLSHAVDERTSLKTIKSEAQVS